MSEKCKTCKEEFDSGIWLSPQFKDEKVLLFCSEKCREEYIKMKLRRLKWNYPKYYEKVMGNIRRNKFEKDVWQGWGFGGFGKNKEMEGEEKVV